MGSGVTLLEGAREQGVAGCPIDWVFALSAKTWSAQLARALRRGARLRARWGPGAKPLVGVQGVKLLEAVVFFNAETAFSIQTYIHKIGKFKTFLQTEKRQPMFVEQFC